MEIGKVPHDVLKNIVFDKLKFFDPDVMIKPGIGEDCAVLNCGEQLAVLSCDPITGASKEVGRLAVHVSCNDIAACGIRPLGLLVSILLPPGTTENDLENLMTEIAETATAIGVSVIGGHTEVTDAVTRVVINMTAIGISRKEKIICSSGAKPGDKIVVTKTVGLEGTAIIANEKEPELKKVFGQQFVDKAKSCITQISVVEEGIVAGEIGPEFVHAMHDITEGGVFGAAWEMAEASGAGVIVFADSIPVASETETICGHFRLNPCRFISSGSMMVATSNPELLIEKLNEKGIRATVVGEFLEKADERFIVKTGEKKILEPPKSDELYKLD
ncbi:AIR synthase family protein [Methanolapillus millepedarum]|uniref:Thiamine-monophosphate kinase n=1 Tax=Methanolapillus millepedarum TaxID=3028296 RepID=A0AA96ZVI3_9EURY|nr:Thiamine-monophosphate kinase [Methanosarcinaceae archaeon Ac7]